MSFEEKYNPNLRYVRNLIEDAPDALVVINLEGKIIQVNKAAIAAIGVARQKLLGHVLANYFTNPLKAEGIYRQAFTEGFVSDFSLTLKGKRKKLVELNCNASVYRDDRGKIIGVLTIARDITLIKQNVDYTRSLVETLLDPLMAMTSEGVITDVNEASVEAIGMLREKLIGTSISNYVTAPEDAVKILQSASQQNQMRNHPMSIRHSTTGKETPVLFNASLSKSKNRQPREVIASAHDISDLKEYVDSNEIRKRNAKLEQRASDLESFSYFVSHDLRGPLMGIDAFTTIFLSHYLEKVDEEGQRLLRHVKRNVAMMNDLINSMLALSGIGAKELDVAEINTAAVLDHVVEELTDSKSRAFITFSGFEPVPVIGDLPLIKQVFVNLISNALKYSRKSDPPKIEIVCRKEDGEVQFYIKDNGIGFDMDYSSKLFEAFQRLHSDPHEYPGTGVGLAIVKRIVERHGGRVWAEGKVGEGATFYFSLPASPPAQDKSNKLFTESRLGD